MSGMAANTGVHRHPPSGGPQGGRAGLRCPVATVMVLALAAAGVGSAGAQDAPRVQATLSPEATVPGPQITVGDLGSVTGDETLAARVRGVVVGQAPLPGRDRFIDVDYIRIRLRQSRVDPGCVDIAAPARVRVWGGGHALTPDDQVRHATEALRGALALPEGADVAIEPTGLPTPLMIPEGDLKVAAELPVGVTLGSVRIVRLRVTVNGALVGTPSITLRVRVLTPAWVSTRALAPGVPLGSDDARIEKRDVAGLERPLPTGQPVAGLCARRAVAAGAVLTSATMCAAPVVRKGETLSVVLSAGSIRVRMAATALEDGAEGDTIRALNSASGQQYRVCVGAPGRGHTIVAR